MDEGTSYFHILITGGGTIGYILWSLSLLTTTLIVRMLLRVRRARLVPQRLRRQLLTLLPARQVAQAMEMASRDPSMLGGLVHAALREQGRGYAAMEQAMEETAQQRSVVLMRQIEWLNIIGNVAPMLGLLGTVWGMILAFFKIVEMGGMANPSSLAGAIGVKLVSTLLGLVVAIPAMACYAILRNRLDELTDQALAAAQELIGRVGASDAPAPHHPRREPPASP